MALPYPTDPSLPANPAPLFSDSTAARGDHLRANNAEIWANFTEIVGTMLGKASISTDGTFAALSDLLFPSEKAINTYLNSVIDALFPPGVSIDYSGVTPPAKWMTEDGSSLLRSSYPVCWANLHSVIGTCTISIANPGVVTSVLHPFITGDCIHFTTTGALPTGLSASTGYYVIAVDGNTFRLATTYANALAGTAIDTSGTQSGTHTLVWSPWNIADSTHFYIPDTRGLLTEGHGTGASAPVYNPWLSSTYTGRLGQYKQDQMQGHRHAPLSPQVYFFGYLPGGSLTYPAGSSADNAATTGNPVTDGTNGTPRTGTRTSHRNRLMRVYRRTA